MLPRFKSHSHGAQDEAWEQNGVPWYWRVLAFTSSLAIVGGFLMLPVTFSHDSDNLRISSQAIGIFAVAVLAAGLSFTGLLAFAVRDTTFLTSNVYTPALTSCAVGLLTVLYDFIVNQRYYWNTPAYLTIIVAALSSLGYGGLLVFSQRRESSKLRRSVATPVLTPIQAENNSMERLVPRYQDEAYYDNYIRNMFPASAPATPRATSHDFNPLSEEDMQRQQMLMLLQRSPATPSNASQSTFHIDWRGQDDVQTPSNGSYAPGAQTGSSSSSAELSGVSRTWTGQSLQPWDGVWRDTGPASMQAPPRARAPSSNSRDERRRQIESGR